MRHPNPVTAFLCLLVAILMTACGGGAAPEKPAQLYTMSLSVKSWTVPVGMSTQVFASGAYTDGTSRSLNVEWTSSDPTVAAVSSDGLVRGLKPGNVQFTARFGPTPVGDFTGLIAIQVTPAIESTALAWSGSRIVAVGGSVGTSTNGVEWSSASSPIGTVQSPALSEAMLNATSWDGAQFVAVGRNGGRFPCAPGNVCSFAVAANNSVMFRSADGLAWTRDIFAEAATVLGAGLNGVASGGGKSVAVGERGFILSTSGNGIWQSQFSGTTTALSAIAWSGTGYLAVGEGGAILSSADGIAWTPRASGTGAALNTVVWTGNRFIAAGRSGAIIASPDGVTWTAQASNTTQSLHGLAWSGMQFVVVGDNGFLATSTDGSTWTTRASGTNSSLKSAVWAGTQFIVAGGTAIIASRDGVTWNSVVSP